LLFDSDKALHPVVVDPTVDSANPTLRLQPLLWGINATALRLVGGGKIDGQGPGWWPYKPSGLTPTTADQLPPYFFECYGCDQLYLGDITIEDCPFVCAHPKQAHDVHIRGVNISNPIDSPNTDCVDPDSLIDTVIEDSIFACGDDHISVKAITQHTSNLVVQNCTFLHGQGMTIGSKVLKGMTNITWRDSVAIGALTGIRLKGIRSQGGVIENLLYENIHFRSVGLLMTIDLDFHHEGTVSEPARVQRHHAPKHYCLGRRGRPAELPSRVALQERRLRPGPRRGDERGLPRIHLQLRQESLPGHPADLRC